MVSERALEYSLRFKAFAAEAPPNPTLEESRRNTANLFEAFGTPIEAKCEAVSANGVSALWITPANSVANRVVMFIHGGGYMTGSPSTHVNGASQLANRIKARALLPDYRLSPDHTFPAQIHDCASVYQWLLKNGYRPQDIVFAGESAGGSLCVTTQLLARDRKLPLPAAAYAMSPWIDLACEGESYTTNLKNDIAATPEMAMQTATLYRGQNSDPSDPLLNVLKADLTGLSPMFVQAGGSEILRDDSVSLVKRAREHGVVAELDIVPEMQHMFQLDAGKMIEADAAMDRGAEFLRRYLAS